MCKKSDPVFSLTCVCCDAGEGIQNHAEASRLGWKEITPDPSGLSWNHVGVCPDCAPRWFGPEQSEGGTEC